VTPSNRMTVVVNIDEAKAHLAQASQGNLRLVTADRVLLGPGRDFLIDAGCSK
jgi:hypothetical protein